MISTPRLIAVLPLNGVERIAMLPCNSRGIVRATAQFSCIAMNASATLFSKQSCYMREMQTKYTGYLYTGCLGLDLG